MATKQALKFSYHLMYYIIATCNGSYKKLKTHLFRCSHLTAPNLFIIQTSKCNISKTGSPIYEQFGAYCWKKKKSNKMRSMRAIFWICFQNVLSLQLQFMHSELQLITIISYNQFNTSWNHSCYVVHNQLWYFLYELQLQRGRLLSYNLV